jgi:FMN phosphatase YigB (HAD superfamily)
MIGDNLEADIATPLRLGMHTIWVDATGRGVPPDVAAKPHRVIRAVAELLTPTASSP